MFLKYIKKEDGAANFITTSLFVAVFAGAWDAWWHSFLGRESFWSPPHLLLYLSTIVTILTALYAWRKYKTKQWKWLGIVLLLVPLSAPFDELWHRAFGVEELSSVLILWSPPHIVLILSLLGAFVLLLPILKKNQDIVKQRFFGSLVLAGIFSLLSILVVPFAPINSPWNLIGFWGAGVMSFVVVLVLFFARYYLPSFGRTTLTAFVILVLVSIGFAEATSSGVTDVAPHTHAPGWLIILSLLLPAVFLDIIKQPKKWSAAIAGFISGGVLYGFATFFFEPAFQYGLTETSIALSASFVGGLLAYFVASFVLKKLSINT